MGVQQGGDQGDAAAAEAPDGGGKADNAHRDLYRKEHPLGGCEAFGLLVLFGPHEQTIVLAQALGFAEVHFAALVQARDHVHALFGPGRQSGVFAVSPVAQEDVALFEMVPQCAQQAQVVVMEAVQNDVEDGPAGQGHRPSRLHR